MPSKTTVNAEILIYRKVASTFRVSTVCVVDKSALDHPMHNLNRHIFPLPLVDWTDVLRADDPTRSPSRARLRTLASKQQVSSGFVVVSRHGGRLAGRNTYFSTLWGFAARARSQAEVGTASNLEQEAWKLESRFRNRLEKFFATHTLDQLPDAYFFEDLVRSTTRALQQSGVMKTMVVVAGHVSELNHELLRVSGYRAEVPQDVALPAGLANANDLEMNDAVWVISRPTEAAAVVEVLPAAELGVEDLNAASLDHEEAIAAARYRATIAADLDDAYFADLAEAEKGQPVPVKRLTLAL